MKPEEPVWPEPDPWQCDYVAEDGRHCVFGKNHTVGYHRLERVMPAADSFLPADKESR